MKDWLRIFRVVHLKKKYYGELEVHYQEESNQKQQAPCGEKIVGVDKGYTEVLTDSEGEV